MRAIWRKTGLLAALALLLGTVAACGNKPDVSIFVMFPQHTIFSKQKELTAALQEKMGESPTVQFSISPIFDQQKMIIEMAAGPHGIFALPKAQYEGFLGQDGFVPLDDILDKEQYPEGVYEDKLIAVPLHETKLLKDAGYTGGEIFAFISERVKDKEKAKQVLKVLAER